MSFGTYNRIKVLRKSGKLSQTDFAQLFGATQTAVSNWEKGKNSIDVSTADKIADYFKVPVEFVYGKAYTLTRTIDKWSEDEISEYNKASDEEKEYFGFVSGRGVFESSGTTINTQNSKSDTVLSEDDIKVALFGGCDEVTDEMWQEVKRYIEYIKSKR